MRKIKPPTLRPHEEEEILQFINKRAKEGEPIVRQDIIDLVVKFLKSDQRKNPFRNGVPGDKWFCLFRRRHNAHFIKLHPDMLTAAESVGFTEKVLNTVSYSKLPKTPIPMRDPIFPRKRRKRHMLIAESPTASEESSHNSTTDDADTSRPQEMDSQRGTPDFRPGSKLEVMDFNEKWYPVKVVEVDYEEGEVLVHFEKWSDRYDEWMSMDSNRIRQPVLSQTSVTKKTFAVNEKVIAVWAYNHKYPATVRQILPNDKYEVLFCDGYAKILRGCKLFKASEEDLKNVQLPPPKKPAPPMGADPLDPDLGPKEERRLKKRRLDVLEAYLPQKKIKSEPQVSPEPQPSTSSYQPKEMPKLVLKAKGRPPLKRKPKLGDDDDEDDDDYDDDDDDDDVAEEEEVAEDKKVEPEQVTEKKRRGRKKKKPFDESNYKYRPKTKMADSEDSERWNTEIPKGASPVQIRDQEGYYRKSVIIPDKKLPEGWTKHTLRRKKGAKWDVLLVNPEGRKFRSRSDLRNFYAEMKKPFPEESFDFMVGRKMEMIKSQEDIRKKMVPADQVGKSSPVHKPDGEGSGEHRKVHEGTADSKRIKTMLPKSRLSDAPRESRDGSPSSSPMNKLSAPPFTLADVKNPDGGFTCCGKSFRKENLFQMHMKHYHPEYSNLFGSTPNVADLAYARTVGEPLEDSRAEVMTPRNSLAERVTKYEEERARIALSDTSTTTTTVPDTSVTANEVAASDISSLLETSPEPDKTKEIEEKDPIPTPIPSAEIEDTADSLTSQSPAEEQTTPVEEDNVEEDEREMPKEEERDTPVTHETTEKEESAETTDMNALPSFPGPEVEKKEDPSDVQEEVDDSTRPEVKGEVVSPERIPTPPPPTPPTEVTTIPSSQSLPVIKPVSKVTPSSSKSAVTSEAVVVQTTASPKTPVTITKYIPPGQKLVSATTKVTISVPATEKETKPTIKTLLPMPPPPPEPKEAQETQKPKESKPKEDVEEKTPVTSRPRKRTVSESLPKKPKLVKPSTGSLEEPDAAAEVPSSPTVSSTSYRFSRNRTIPRVSLKKLDVTSDRNGSEGPSENITEPPQHTVANDLVYENLRKEEIINCICGYMEEDGLMIQCDLCLCWQHGMCNNINKEADVPEKYVCYTCQHPAHQRASSVHHHNQDWLKEGQLPSLMFRPKNESVLQRETMLKKSHDLVSSVLQLRTVIHSLRVKTHIATRSDHPKLYLWAKSWKIDNSGLKNKNEEDSLKQGPQPEAAIDETECRLQLLEHVEDYQNQVDDRLTSIQAQIAALESEDPDLASDEASDHYPVTKQTVQMVLRDLSTVRKVAALN